MKNLTLIFNTKSGGYNDVVAKKIVKALGEGFNMNVELPQSAEDVVRIASESKADILAVAGGDGSILHAVSGLIKNGSSPVFAAIPLGTANVLCHELGIKSDIHLALEAIRHGDMKDMHLGQIIQQGQKRFFTCMAGVGVDASAVKNVSLRLKKFIGKPAYIYSLFKVLFTRKYPVFSVDVNGVVKQAIQAFFMKSKFYGGNTAIAPEADISKAGFKLILVSEFRFFALLSDLFKLLKGKKEGLKICEVADCTSARISDIGVPVQADGDYLYDTPMQVSIYERPLKVISRPKMT